MHFIQSRGGDTVQINKISFHVSYFSKLSFLQNLRCKIFIFIKHGLWMSSAFILSMRAAALQTKAVCLGRNPVCALTAHSATLNWCNFVNVGQIH